MTASGFEEFEDLDYDHETHVDEVADQIYDGLIDLPWVKQIGIGAGGMIITDVNGKCFLVKTSEYSSGASRPTPDTREEG